MDTEKMTTSGFLKLWQDNEQEAPEGFTVVDAGEWTQDYKYQCCDTVYREDATGRFFCVSQSRAGSYHTDWYYNEPACYEVYAHTEVKTVTTYHTGKPTNAG